MSHKAPSKAENTAKAHAMLKSSGYAKGGAVKGPINIIIKTGGDPKLPMPMPVPIPAPSAGPGLPPAGQPPMMRPGIMAAPPGAPPGMPMRPPGLKTGGVVKVRSHVRRKSGGKVEK